MNKRKAFIPITALMAALLLALVAAMTPFVAERDVAHAQSQSTDTTLYALSMAGQGGTTPTVTDFEPDFVPGGAPASDGYTVYVANNKSTVNLTATASHTGATVEVKAGADEDSAVVDATPSSIDLQDAGQDTVILVTVTAADKVETDTYKITVVRGATGSDDASLSELSLTAGGEEVALAEDFASNTYVYTVRVANATSAVNVVAKPTDQVIGATYIVESDKDDDVQNNQVDLEPGANVITVKVTAADKITTTNGTYTVTVTRVASNISTDTTLDVLTLNDGEDVPLSPSFSAGSTPRSGGYTAEVDDVTSVTLTAVKSHTNATVEVKAGADEDAAKGSTAITVGGSNAYTLDTSSGFQDEGRDTVVLITVTAEDLVTKATYKLTVERAAAVASTTDTLSALSITVGGKEVEYTTPLTPNDDSAVTVAAKAPYSASQAKVMPTTTNRDATYVVESDKDSSVGRNGEVDLSEGLNVITIKVTAKAGPATSDTNDDCADSNPDGNILCYTVNLTRALSTDSRQTTLTALSIAAQSDTPPTVSAFEPEFDPDGAPASGGYSAYATSGTGTVSLTATPSHTSASVEVKAGADEEAAMAADAEADLTSISLQDAGRNTVILVTVTAADGFAKATYKLTVMRGTANSATTTLSELEFTAGGEEVDIGTFVSTTYTGYAASVPYATRKVEVTAKPTGERGGATYKVTSNKDSSIQNNKVVDLSVGANTITVTVTAADRVTTSPTAEKYTVTVTRVSSNLSTDTTLSVLSVADNGTDLELDPKFVSNKNPEPGGYDAASIDHDDTQVTVTATAAHTGATIEVRAGASEAAAMKATVVPVSGINEYEVTTARGLQGEGEDTIILVTVTAADLVTTGTYKITVPKGASDDENQLKELTVPGWKTTTLNHTDNFIHRTIVDVPSVTVVAKARNSKATVTIKSDNDDEVVDNVVDLEVGINIITVNVDPAVGGTEKDYTLRIRRDKSDDDSLSMLSLKHLPMNMMAGTGIDLTDMDGTVVMFSSGKTTYSADAGHAESITVSAAATHPEAMVAVSVGGTAAMKIDIGAYWNMLGCPAMNDAVGADDEPDDSTSPYCKMYADLDADAKKKVDATYANYYSVPLEIKDDNTVTATVTSEDEAETETYTVTVKRTASTPADRLLNLYDANDDDKIDLDEVNKAIDDFFAGTIPLDDLLTVIDLFFIG